uniref:Uncharacterized protein n=1 Tax=Ditylenchus dipsaci TaxID=166011 RepID=A0A915CPL2_9BILA
MLCHHCSHTLTSLDDVDWHRFKKLGSDYYYCYICYDRGDKIQLPSEDILLCHFRIAHPEVRDVTVKRGEAEVSYVLKSHIVDRQIASRKRFGEANQPVKIASDISQDVSTTKENATSECSNSATSLALTSNTKIMVQESAADQAQVSPSVGYHSLSPAVSSSTLSVPVLGPEVKLEQPEQLENSGDLYEPEEGSQSSQTSAFASPSKTNECLRHELDPTFSGHIQPKVENENENETPPAEELSADQNHNESDEDIVFVEVVKSKVKHQEVLIKQETQSTAQRCAQNLNNNKTNSHTAPQVQLQHSHTSVKAIEVSQLPASKKNFKDKEMYYGKKARRVYFSQKMQLDKKPTISDEEAINFLRTHVTSKAVQPPLPPETAASPTPPPPPPVLEDQRSPKKIRKIQSPMPKKAFAIAIAVREDLKKMQVPADCQIPCTSKKPAQVISNPPTSTYKKATYPVLPKSSPQTSHTPLWKSIPRESNTKSLVTSVPEPQIENQPTVADILSQAQLELELSLDGFEEGEIIETPAEQQENMNLVVEDELIDVVGDELIDVVGDEFIDVVGDESIATSKTGLVSQASILSSKERNYVRLRDIFNDQTSKNRPAHCLPSTSGFKPTDNHKKRHRLNSSTEQNIKRPNTDKRHNTRD